MSAFTRRNEFSGTADPYLIGEAQMPMDLCLHRQAENATATDFRLQPRKPFHPHRLKPSGFTGSSVRQLSQTRAE